jgi:hypothetical protein
VWGPAVLWIGADISEGPATTVFSDDMALRSWNTLCYLRLSNGSR